MSSSNIHLAFITLYIGFNENVIGREGDDIHVFTVSSLDFLQISKIKHEPSYKISINQSLEKKNGAQL